MKKKPIIARGGINYQASSTLLFTKAYTEKKSFLKVKIREWMRKIRILPRGPKLYDRFSIWVAMPKSELNLVTPDFEYVAVHPSCCGF